MNAEVHLIAVLSPDHGHGRMRPPVTPYPSYDGAVLAVRTPPAIAIETRDQVLAAERADAEDYVPWVAHRFDDLPTTRVLLRRSLGEAIVEYAQETGIDLIMMPTDDCRRPAQALLGSVPAEFVRSGVAPCLLVKPKEAGASRVRSRR